MVSSTNNLSKKFAIYGAIIDTVTILSTTYPRYVYFLLRLRRAAKYTAIVCFRASLLRSVFIEQVDFIEEASIGRSCVLAVPWLFDALDRRFALLTLRVWYFG